MSRYRPRGISVAVAAACASLMASSLTGQEVALQGEDGPPQDYIRYVPLSYPRLVRQTGASEEFHLYGDPTDSSYVDEHPRNGIDDRRDVLLQDLGDRFAPILVQNTTAFPMDFKRFLIEPSADSVNEHTPGQELFPLILDTWDVAAPAGTPPDEARLGRESLDFARVGDPPCTDTPESRRTQMGAFDYGLGEGNDDCRLLNLLDRFDPASPSSERLRTMTVGSDHEIFEVLYFDFPGYDEKTWKEAYENPPREVPNQYVGYQRTYAHPLILEVRPDPAGGESARRFQLAIQYWFFYPWNDGGNNHEGDWEHINVIIAPRDRVDEPLSEHDLKAILQDESRFSRTDDPRELVIQRVEFYFHHKVMVLDYAHPNAYQPRDRWEAEVDSLVQNRVGEKWFWERVRNLAYWDDAETKINTQAVGYIGADNKGTDQLLSSPGGKNRDSHGTYPLPGLYKNVGPLGASEEIEAQFDHREFFAKRSAGAGSRGGIWSGVLGPRSESHGRPVDLSWPDSVFESKAAVLESLDLQTQRRSSPVLIVPDWERVAQLVREEPATRREWAWLVLPIRWGYPAAESPAAGIIAHAETGNLSVVGPAFNSGWNRLGASAGYEEYSPHKFPALFALSWQDNFENELGYLNLTGPTLTYLPPFDFLWRLVAAPLRIAFGNKQQTYFPSNEVPFRLLGLSGGVSWQYMPDEFSLLFYDEALGVALVDELLALDPEALDAPVTPRVDNATSWAATVSFFIGRRFASENTLRHQRSSVGALYSLNGGATPYQMEGDLNFWEWAGVFRYNLLVESVQPFLKLGYGWSWYRLENITANGGSFAVSQSEWVRQPSLFPPQNLLPNTWQLGAGLEVLAIRNVASIPSGIDLGARIEYGLFLHSLGLRLSNDLSRLSADLDTNVARHSVILQITVSF